MHCTLAENLRYDGGYSAKGLGRAIHEAVERAGHCTG